jgi:hypothetical protein
MSHDTALKARAQALKLHGLLSQWETLAEHGWIEPLIRCEEQERARRSLERRTKAAHLGRFKPLADFDWGWPSQCEREQVQELMRLEFLGAIESIISKY